MIDHLKQDSWFVDIRGQVSGPMTSWDIIQKLISGEIKVIHRVSQDRANWKGICNEKYFENAVNTAIDFYSSQAGSTNTGRVDLEDNEETGFANLDGISKGISAQLDHAQSLQEINVGLNSLRKLLSDIHHHRKTVIEAKPAEKDEVHPEDRHVYVGMETVDNQSFLSRYRFLTVVLVLGFFVLAGLKFLEYLDHQEQKALDEQVKALQKEKALSGYDEAFEKGKGLNSGQLLEMAEDEIEKGNMKLSTQLLNRAIEIASVGPEKAKAHSLLGYVATQEKDLQKAIGFYESSLKSSKKLYLTYHNYGLLKLKSGDYVTAETLLLKAMQLEQGPSDRSATILGLIEVASQLDQKDNSQAQEKMSEKDKLKFVPVFNRLNKASVLLARMDDSYIRERLIAELHMDQVRQRKQLDKAKLLQFLKVKDQDLQPVQKLSGLELGFLNWEKLYNWCLPIYNMNRRAVHLNAFFGYCVYRFKGAKAAMPYIDFAAQKAPHDPIYKRYKKKLQDSVPGTGNDSIPPAKGG